MVRNRSSTTDRCCSWSEESMLSAMKAFKEDGMPLATAAKTFGVPRNTLRRRVMSNVEIPKFGQHTAFSKNTEDELVGHKVRPKSTGNCFPWRCRKNQQ